MHRLQAPRIVRNRGWSFVMYEPQSRTPFKPGIVAEAAEAMLALRIVYLYLLPLGRILHTFYRIPHTV